MTVEISDADIKQSVKTAIEKHGSTREAVIPILTDLNRDFGHIPADAFHEVRRQLRLAEDGALVSESQLFSVASFYHMLSTKPMGRHVVRFCESAPCHVMGGRELIQAVIDELQIQPGQTSPDNRWSLVTTSCLGVCGVGPVLLVDDDIYGNLTPVDLPGIFSRYE